MTLTKLSDIDPSLELWRGTKIRLVNDGTNLHPNDEHFDYLLATLPWDKDNMILVNVTQNSHKEGAVYGAKVPVDRSLNKIIVNREGLRKALGPDFDNCYLITNSTSDKIDD
ncbi:MAG: hypothetical protein RIF36_11570 [Imperialibacter sp.]|uniref:hypothetical protein n=1 Tax=Imperialibacter sp. TaxID=2038411 RepID=UPI0032EFF23B